ncbi:MAG: class I SAM-dependent methyltransferase, partial [bacterium]|nr:class I SAM-dependent methyltransferase [bacterium]
MRDPDVQARELAHHEEVYSGFAQEHFAKPGVRAFRKHLVDRILRRSGATAKTSVLSLGCGIGDTELLLAPGVAHITGIDLSPSAIRQARADSTGVDNVEFIEGDHTSTGFPPGSFDLILAIFLLHHLPDEELGALPPQVNKLLAEGGVFYSIDPSRYRLSGAIGKLLAPKLMAKHQSPDERELAPKPVRALFERAGLQVQLGMYDFCSTPVAGLFPGSKAAYAASRLADDVLTRL